MASQGGSWRLPSLTPEPPLLLDRHLVDHCGDRLAAGKAELHDVGELPAGVFHRHVVGQDQSLQGLGEGLKLNQAA